MSHSATAETTRRVKTLGQGTNAATSDQQAWRELRDEFLSAFKTATGREFADLTGSTAKNPAARAYEWTKAGRIFGVNDGRQVRYPLFQLKDGRPIPEVTAILRSLRARNFSAWEIAMWFFKPNENIGDWKTPADALARDPAMVVAAAAIEAEEQVY